MRPLAYPPPHRRNMYQNLAKNNLKHSKIFPKCATGGVHRGGCMPARERAPKRLPCAAFFGILLARRHQRPRALPRNSFRNRIRVLYRLRNSLRLRLSFARAQKQKLILSRFSRDHFCNHRDCNLDGRYLFQSRPHQCDGTFEIYRSSRRILA